MENDKTINPELVKWCADAARPDRIWRIIQVMGFESLFDAVISKENPRQREETFNPLTSADDLCALEEKIERDGWVFKYNDVTDSFTAEKKMELVSDLWVVEKTKALRALACASTQSGIPMYVGGGK